MEEARREGRGSDERWHVRRDGSRFFALGEMMMLRDEAGTATGFLKILRDRTDQRHAAMVLRDSEARVDTALGTGLVGFFEWEASDGLVRADACFAGFCGLDAASLAQGMPLAEVAAAIHARDREEFARSISDRAADEHTRQFRVVGPGSEARSVLVGGRRTGRDGARVLRVTGIAIDVSATLDAQEALRASETFNRDVLASSSDCVKVLDLEGRLRFMSEGGMRTMEIDDFRDFEGCPWPDFWHGRENVLARAALDAARAGGRGQFQGYTDTAKGNSRYWDVVVTPMLGADGRPERLLSISRDVTENRLAGERIEMALEAGSVTGTWIWDVQADRLIGDARMARAFGVDAAALAAGMAAEALVAAIHPDDVGAMHEEVVRARAQGGAFRAEYRVRNGGGVWAWVEANGRCDLDEDGRPVRFPGILVDIDRRKRHELRQAAVLELGSRLRDGRDIPAMAAIAAEVLGRTLEVSRAGYGSVDAAREVTRIEQDWCADPALPSIAGPHALRAFGSFIEDLKRGETVAIADVALDPRTRASAARFEALRIGGLLNVPLLGKRGMEAVLVVHTVGPHAWRDDEIDFVRTVADRTWAAMGQAAAEAELRRINATLEQQVAERTAERDRLWDTSPDLMLVIGFDGVFRRVNPAWTVLLGYAEAELVGHHVNEFVIQDDHRETVEAYELAAEGGSPRIENRYLHRDGTVRRISWVGAPAGDMTYATGRDVTFEREAADALHRAEEQLRQSQKMEAVGQLTGGLAHDFNNLLTGVMGSLELLQTRIAQGRVSEVGRYVDAAQGGARRAAALTHRLLAFSRRQTLDPRVTDAGRLVAGMEELVRRTVGPEVGLEIATADGLWSTLVDPGQLENALLNLCINARDAMPDGGRITVETANRRLDERAARERELAPGQYVSLCVSDTGTGMAPEVVAKAFDPFFTTKPLGQGTGLGLSMIYGFARQSGGQVRIHSAVGRGTTVCLHLPRHLGEADADEAAPVPAAVPRAGQGETVLVVDDEASVRMLVVEVLQDLGYVAIEAADGAAGLRVLQSGARVDLLVTDVGLPGGMNGRQLADAARAARAGLKVLFITGYAENAVLGHSHLDRDMHVLTKPFAMEALATRIKALIDS
ncbi:MAG: PAS domain S-box protein, partial [Janthinobacterium lividum]